MKKEKRVFSEEVKEQFEKLTDAFALVETEGITVMTGNNGSGKSMIRKQLPFALRDRLGIDAKDAQRMIMSTSMDARTGSRPDLGGLSGMMRDTEWIATSQNTFHSIKGLLESAAKSENGRYLVIDEYEIGCSEETIMALAHYISTKLQELMKDGHIDGAMIITHSRIGLQNIEHDHFINIGGLTEEEWLNREVKPTDLEKLDENELFFYIRDNE